MTVHEMKEPARPRATPSAQDLTSAGLASTGDPVVDDVLHATLNCIETNGFNRTTVDDIVRASGVPRTTIYRKIGSREAIIRAMLAQLAVPYYEQCQVIATGPGSLAERIEDILVTTVNSMQSFPWLVGLLREGLSPDSFHIFEVVTRSLGATIVHSILQQALESGHSKIDASVDEVTVWLLRQNFLISTTPFKDEAALRRHIRTFIIPVFRLQETKAPQPGLEERLDRIEHTLSLLVKREDRKGS